MHRSRGFIQRRALWTLSPSPAHGCHPRPPPRLTQPRLDVLVRSQSPLLDLRPRSTRCQWGPSRLRKLLSLRRSCRWRSSASGCPPHPASVFKMHPCVAANSSPPRSPHATADEAAASGRSGITRLEFTMSTDGSSVPVANLSTPVRTGLGPAVCPWLAHALCVRPEIAATTAAPSPRRSPSPSLESLSTRPRRGPAARRTSTRQSRASAPFSTNPPTHTARQAASPSRTRSLRASRRAGFRASPSTAPSTSPRRGLWRTTAPPPASSPTARCASSTARTRPRST